MHRPRRRLECYRLPSLRVAPRCCLVTPSASQTSTPSAEAHPRDITRPTRRASHRVMSGSCLYYRKMGPDSDHGRWGSRLVLGNFSRTAWNTYRIANRQRFPRFFKFQTWQRITFFDVRSPRPFVAISSSSVSSTLLAGAPSWSHGRLIRKTQPNMRRAAAAAGNGQLRLIKKKGFSTIPGTIQPSASMLRETTCTLIMAMVQDVQISKSGS